MSFTLFEEKEKRRRSRMEKKEREEKKAKKQANPQLAQIKFLIKNNLPVEYYLGYSLSPKYTILIYSDGTMIF